MSRKHKRRTLPKWVLQAGIRNPEGRPKGSLKKFPFEQTRLGFMLKYESPAVFDLIIELSPHSRKTHPHPALVSAVCSASQDPAFEKPKFRTYLDEYVRCGVYCKRGKKLTPERERYYERIRRNKLEKYIRLHREEIENMRLVFSRHLKE